METSVVRTGNGSSQSLMESIQRQIETAEKEGYNMLMPSQIVSEIPAMHNVTIEYEKISSNPEDGDVYPKGTGEADKGKFILTKQALIRLCSCAGIEWNWGFCGRTDDRRDRDYISYRMVGAVRKLDGTWYPLQGEYDIDMEVREEELRDQYSNRCKNWQKPQKEKDGYVESSTKREMIRIRRHKLALCETGAMLRAIRGLLIIRNSYTAEKLEKPFVITRLAFAPDYNDPEIRQQFVAAATKAITGIYGGSQSVFGEKNTQQFPDLDTIGHTTDDTEEPDPDHGNPLQDPPNGDGDDEPPTQADLDREAFMNLKPPGQVEALKVLAKSKNYDLTAIKAPLEKWGEVHRVGFYDKLVEPENDDDIPF